MDPSIDLLPPASHRTSLPERSGSVLSRQSEFASVLSRERTGVAAIARDAPASPEEEAREAARQFVSIALVQPILRQFREGSQAEGMFAPSKAELQFRAMQDAALAQRITRAANFPLVDRLARDLLKGSVA
jgi:Rod binding domain-containing protein